MRILITGGAGYIGSHLARQAAEAGHQVVVFDNLGSGHRALLQWGDFVEGDLRCQESLQQLFSAHSFDAVMHLAAFVEVEASVRDPLYCYSTNMRGSQNLIDMTLSAGVSRFIFSSTGSVYGGCPSGDPISERQLPSPQNPYAASKLAVEHLLGGLDAAGVLKSVSLRFFNVAGAHPDGTLGPVYARPTHLIPLLLRAASGESDSFVIHGDGYATADGTCVRDFVHVHDIARAHLAALEHLADDGAGGCFNLGTGRGHSVRQVLDATVRVTGASIEHSVQEPRPGDSAALVADSSLATEVLGWQPRHAGLEEIIEHAWRWQQSPARAQIMGL